MTGFRNRSSCGLVGARSTDRSGVVTAPNKHPTFESGASRLSQDDLVEIENWALNAGRNHSVCCFHDAAKACSQAASHAALDRDLYARFAIDAQRLRDGPKSSVHWLGSTGIDLIRPLNEVADHLCGESAVTTAAIIRRHAILDPLRQLGSGQQPRLGRGSHNEHHVEVLCGRLVAEHYQRGNAHPASNHE